MIHDIPALQLQTQLVLSDSDLSDVMKSLLILSQVRAAIPLSQVHNPKQTPARWRGKRISKSHYTQSHANDEFESHKKPGRDDGGRKEDEEDKNHNENNDNGDDGEEDEPDRVQVIEAIHMIDPKAFYGYLFEDDKTPSKVLDAMLRGIAKHIVENIEPRDVRHLTPDKLSSFYRSVGGNYDSLFKDVPYPSISWIYASIGCEYSIQPSGDDFGPRFVPVLTDRGFVRWQSTELLLGPEEHVPFLQKCINQFDIKNPDTDDEFPKGLPSESFPTQPDEATEKWHAMCAEKLRQERGAIEFGPLTIATQAREA